MNEKGTKDMRKNNTSAYKILRPIITFIFKSYYNPTIINQDYIPKEGAAVIAGNHKHALDPILVDVCTNRVIHTLAKKDLHDGKFGWFFRAIESIPVDLKAEHNKAALLKSIDYLNEGALVNVSPEAKRNYTNEILLPFKFGSVVMAKRTNCKIIPYSITGDYKFRSKNLKITFGEPLDVSGSTVEEANVLLYENVKELLLAVGNGSF
jgi:1-acyl-sn-glycerol-3-phosphate acyltransferase